MIASRGTSTLCKLEPPADLWSFATSVRCRTDCLLELEHASSPISGRCFKLSYVVSRSERCGFVLPIRMRGVDPKKSASVFLLLHTACQHALRQQSLADLAYSTSELATIPHADYEVQNRGVGAELTP